MILALYDWLSHGCPDGVPVKWLYQACRRERWRAYSSMSMFEDEFPWDVLMYRHPEYLVRRRGEVG